MQAMGRISLSEVYEAMYIGVVQSWRMPVSQTKVSEMVIPKWSSRQTQ